MARFLPPPGNRTLLLRILSIFLALSFCSTTHFADNTLTPEEVRRLSALEQAKQTASILSIESPAEKTLLETPSRPVDPASPGIDKLIAQMEKTARLQGGSGIAAVQVGIPVRLVLLRRRDGDGGERFQPFINPAIVQRSGKQMSSWEYCLSVPWGYRYTRRPAQITVRYQTATGKTTAETLNSDEAVVFQQEIDHLDGWLLSGQYPREWFVPSREMDAFARGIGRQCSSVSRQRCDELMESAWIARGL